MRILLNRLILKKKITKVIIATDQTKKKRNEGEHELQRAALIVAPIDFGGRTERTVKREDEDDGRKFFTRPLSPVRKNGRRFRGRGKK